MSWIFEWNKCSHIEEIHVIVSLLLTFTHNLSFGSKKKKRENGRNAYQLIWNFREIIEKKKLLIPDHILSETLGWSFESLCSKYRIGRHEICFSANLRQQSWAQRDFSYPVNWTLISRPALCSLFFGMNESGDIFGKTADVIVPVK